ncbi:hypothetical protein ACFSYD_12305 [Paracoccus aerius]|uniref:hypothetical protein n=1 Tax=Paracoccus aerius TaxID=1915382 RepID=UPI0036096FC2
MSDVVKADDFSFMGRLSQEGRGALPQPSLSSQQFDPDHVFGKAQGSCGDL